MKNNFSISLVAIIIFCTLWILFIPGFVAYKNNVFYGWMFKDKIADSIITSRIDNSEKAVKIYQNGILKHSTNNEVKSVSFAGFAENGLNYVWLESYIILCFYAFIIYYPFSRKFLNRTVLFLTFIVLLLFLSPNWFRNGSEIGKYGRTIYSYVNYDIDKLSFWLQEFRAYIFSFLVAVYWYQFELRRKDSLKIIRLSIRNLNPVGFVALAKNTKGYFNNWQRDILVSIVLFLPWTWFFWRNTNYYGDTRFVLQAVIFHSFWLVSIILISRPFITLTFGYWKYRTMLLLNLIEAKREDRLISFVENLEPLPKGQLLLTSVTTLVSLASPLLQFILKA
jgi:hypothetical protein